MGQGVCVKLTFAGAALAAVVLLTSAAQGTAASVDPDQSDKPVALKTSGALPAGTEIFLAMNEELTTLGGRIAVGQQFRLTVAKDVRMGEYVIIPRGTPAVGEVTMVTGKGVFGKSGKMAVAFKYLDLNGRHIPLFGTYRQEGRDNTASSVVALSAVGVLGGVVTGRSANIPAGRQIVAYTEQPLPVAFPEPAKAPTPEPSTASN